MPLKHPLNVQKNQSEYYSGKRNEYTLKAQVIVHWQTGLILDIQTCKGSVHDFKLYKQTCPDWLPDETNYLADSGYQGIAAYMTIPLPRLRNQKVVSY